MKILMFGWEFPPHISGGLGTACLGLTRGLSELPDMDIIFVVPKAWGDEEPSAVKLVGANKVPVNRKWVSVADGEKKMEYYEVQSEVIPYIAPEEFWELKNQRLPRHSHLVQTNDDGLIDFSGTYGTSLYSEIRNYARVAEIIAEEQNFDLVHAHDWLTFPAGIAASRKSGKPLVVHVHATEFDRSGGEINTRIYAIEREGMEAADKVITVSNLTRTTVIEKYGIDPDKVVTVYNAVAPFDIAQKKLIKKKLNDRIVTFLGRITHQKGPEYFVEAAHLVLQKMTGVRFVMAGSGDMMDAMVEHTARLGIAGKFHFTGFLQNADVYRLFQISDVFVMPSVSEPFGIVPLEAMRSEIPVIISQQSGVAELVENAIKIDYWDTFALADSIYGLLTYPALSAMFAQKGKKEVDNLKWKKSAQEVFNVYENVCQ